MSPDVQGALVMVGLFGGLLIVVETWTRLKQPKPEVSRKAVHIGAGLLCLLFPYLLDSPWVVGVLAVVFSLFFAVGQKYGLLHCVGRVERTSRGSEYYPIAVFMLFLLCLDDTWRFVASVLVLAVADAGAALVGTRYGRLRYTVEDSEKSIEGSAAFLVLAFAAIFLPAILLSDLPIEIVALSAFLVALVVTGLEAISLRGTDNLFVPIAAAAILGKITTKPLAEVVYQNLSFIVLIMAGSLIVWRTGYLNAGGGIALIWMVYGAWSLGGEIWAVPIIVSFAVYVLLRLVLRETDVEPVRMTLVFRLVLVPLLILAFANALMMHAEFFPAYLAAGSVLLAHVVWRRVQHSGRGRARYLLASVVAAFAVTSVWWFQDPVPLEALATVVIVATGMSLVLRIASRAEQEPFGPGLFLGACVAAVVTFLIVN